MGWWVSLCVTFRDLSFVIPVPRFKDMLPDLFADVWVCVFFDKLPICFACFLFFALDPELDRDRQLINNFINCIH